MTEVTIEHEEEAAEESAHEIAEEVAEAVVEAQEEAAEAVEHARELDEAHEQSEAALVAVQTHEHPDYSQVGHEHPEYEHHERFSHLENRMTALESRLLEPEEEVAEEIEPTHEPPPEPEHSKRKHRFGKH